MSDALTSVILPKTSATITLRIIKSFEYRTEKNLVLHDTDLEQMTVGGLKLRVLRSGHRSFSHVNGLTFSLQAIHTDPGWKPFCTIIFGGSP